MKLPEISSESTAPDPAKSAKLQDAAGKFEALVIAQMLKSARQSDSGGWSGETDPATSSIMDMAEQSLAEMLGAQGGFGLAKMVVSKVGAKE
jgi:Rod binding domain-containing protein